MIRPPRHIDVRPEDIDPKEEYQGYKKGEHNYSLCSITFDENLNPIKFGKYPLTDEEKEEFLLVIDMLANVLESEDKEAINYAFVSYKYMAKSKSVEILDFLRCHEEIVRHLVSYEDFSVPVMDDASGRVDGGIYHGIVRCISLVLVVKYLNAEQLDDQYGCNGAETYQQLVLPVELHLGLLFSVIRCESVHYNQ